MKAYFIHARNIREFSNIVAEAVLPKSVTPLVRTLPERWVGSRSLARTLRPAEKDWQCDAAGIMEAFRIVQTRHAVLSDRLKTR